VGFLQAQVGLLENESGDVEDKKRKFVWDRIPREVVDDPHGLVQELQWRVERELRKLGLGPERPLFGKVERGLEGDVEDGKPKKGVVKVDRGKKRIVLPESISRTSDFRTT